MEEGLRPVLCQAERKERDALYRGLRSEWRDGCRSTDLFPSTMARASRFLSSEIVEQLKEYGTLTRPKKQKLLVTACESIGGSLAHRDYKPLRDHPFVQTNSSTKFRSSKAQVRLLH